MNRIILITGVSASWKTTTQDELLKIWWKRPINFTTRQPRWDNELDEYVFLKRNQFLTKLWNGDFLENTNYWWNFYWVSKTVEEMYKKWENVCIILDPIGRSQVMEYLSRKWIPYDTYYLRITPKLQEERLYDRWDDDEEVYKRKRDFEWFHPTPKCKIIDWALPVERVIELILNDGELQRWFKKMTRVRNESSEDIEW